ncbi:MAG TPA: transcriptional repressor NrdR [Candidatus Moranbacteria bacterium]|nr:transcriptional repressor NrdR [Candidatus Moranbacteria bacterium]
MRCLYCNFEDTKVIDSRDADEGRSIRRRRECEKCHKRFSTYEQADLNLSVEKRDGSIEEYDKQKMIKSVRIATNKRLKEEEIVVLVEQLEGQIRADHKEKVTSREIGEIIMKALKNKDEVAYLRYVSVFKGFGSGKRFVKEVDKISE